MRRPTGPEQPRARPTTAAGPADGFPVRARPTPAREAELEALGRRIRACRLCSLATHRIQAVVYRGSLAPRVVFVGEAPGAEEDRQGLPFVGRSGEILDRAIAELGPPLGPWGIVNLLKCRPPDNRFDRRAAATCRPYLDRQLELLRPDGLVTLGAHALATLDPAAPRVLLAAGVARPRAAGWLFPMVHPAASLRSRRLRERWERDLRALGSWLGRAPSATL